MRISYPLPAPPMKKGKVDVPLPFFHVCRFSFSGSPEPF